MAGELDDAEWWLVAVATEAVDTVGSARQWRWRVKVTSWRVKATRWRVKTTG